MAVDRRLLLNIDWGLLCRGAHPGRDRRGHHPLRHLRRPRLGGLYAQADSWRLGLGLLALVVAVSVDYRRLADRAPLLYLLALAALAAVLVFGPRIAGTRRWFVIGGFQIQPSEFAKLVAALFVAKVFAESKKDSLGLPTSSARGRRWGSWRCSSRPSPTSAPPSRWCPSSWPWPSWPACACSAILGAAVVLVVVGGLGWMFALKDYQKTRIYSFLDPNLDPRGRRLPEDPVRRSRWARAA